MTERALSSACCSALVAPKPCFSQCFTGASDMNLKEFAALKIGDKIENLMADSKGEVVEVDASGVRVCWGWKTDAPGATRHYSVNTTIWMHWSYAPRDCASGPCYREDCRRGDQCLGSDYAKIAGAA